MVRTVGMHARRAGALVLVFALAAPLAESAGGAPIPLTGPAPIVINTPGRYCLTQDVTGVPAQPGILIVSDDVEVDLGGYELLGVPGATTGIRTQGHDRIRLYNGRVTDWPEKAVALGGESVVRDVWVGGGGAGIEVGFFSKVERCFISFTSGIGIRTSGGGTVRDCTVNLLPDVPAGIQTGGGGTVSSCVVEGGVFGIKGSTRTTVEGCAVSRFESTGIALDEFSIAKACRISLALPSTTPSPTGLSLERGARASHCTIYDVSKGVHLSPQASLYASTVADADIGIQTDSHARVEDCTVSVAALQGIALGEGGRVSRTSVNGGAGHGIVCVGKRAVVEGCMVTDNAGNGIVIGEECVARDNLSSGNGLAGILAIGLRGRIHDNTLDSNHNGLVVQNTHNLSVGNRAANNAGGDYVVPPKNPTGSTLNASWWIQNTNPFANFRTPF